MARRRAKPTAKSGAETHDSASKSDNVSAALYLPFRTGSNLERIHDDILHEIFSYLPTLTFRHMFGGVHPTRAVISTELLVRTPTLRALSQTSRLLRSRCLAMAWQRVELCSARLPEHAMTYYRVVSEATMACTQVLRACPHLLPLIQTVAVSLTRHNGDEIIPAFAACLATLPNLATIQVIHATSTMTTMIKNGFKGKRFPSVRKISLPGCAHDIIKCCPNLEEVICTETEEDGSRIVGSLVKGKCDRVRVIKGMYASFNRLVKLLPNLSHINVDVERYYKIPFACFPFLNTIEIDVTHYSWRLQASTPQWLDPKIEDARKVLRENKSQAEKTVIVTGWTDYNSNEGYKARDVIKVTTETSTN